MKLTKVSQPNESDFEILKNGLIGFNESHTGLLSRQKISSFVKNEEGDTVGGIIGEIIWGWLYIEGLWLPDSIRSVGLGAKLLRAIEEHATSNGINNFRLETTSFQALDFYKKQGYSVFGQLPDMPPGFTSYFLQKQL